MDSQRRKSLLQSLALFTVALLLSSCGGTKENLGPPSIPRDLNYEIVDEGIKLTWKSPIQNFDYKAVYGQDLSDPEYSEGLISANYFKIRLIPADREYIVYQKPDEENYEFTIQAEEFLSRNNFAIKLNAYNEPPTEYREPEGGWTEELRSAGYDAFELQFFQSATAYVQPKLFEINTSPEFIKELVTNDSNSNHNDYFSSTSPSWVSASASGQRVYFCNFLKLDWRNRADYIKIETKGAFTSKNTFTLSDYLKSKCLTIESPKSKRGELIYTIKLINNVGSTSLSGAYVIYLAWPEKG